ncbi:MAG TPA: FG-GAP-like repeat-containing protein [Tepidisphaeraceae bacterium]|nr:FG-GAP-like repeat-containing protein [Tepidisphaeraceae bacterium]
MTKRPGSQSHKNQIHRNRTSGRQVVEAEPLERRAYLDGLNFASPTAFGVGNNPVAIAVGSLRPDGLPDIVTVNKADNTVEVLLNNGNGTFAEHDFDTGGNPDGVAIGDFTNNGINDIAVSCEHDNIVQVFMGNGNGLFGGAISFPVGVSPQGLAVGDFNGDGLQDIAVANFDSNTVSVLMNNSSFLGHPSVAGQGMFLPQQTYAVGINPTSVAIADLDGFGDADIITTNLGSHSLTVLFGNGNGTFGNPQSINVGNDPESVAVGDFNGDGIPDLAVADFYDNNVDILIGNGNGTFQDGVTYYANNGPGAVVVGDMSGDGNGFADLLVANEGTSNNGGSAFSVLQGNGNGTFGLPQTFSTGPRPSAIAVGDFNGDGRLDVATPDSGYTTVDISYNVSTRDVTLPTITKSHHVVSITGTNGSDVIELQNNLAGDLLATIDGLTQEYPLASVQQIDVTMGQQSSSILIEGGLPSCVVLGGPGNDTIIADNGASDTLIGGPGADFISAQGFGGNDLINGGRGSDTLLGGQGLNTIHGGRGHDSIVAGNSSGGGLFIGGPGTDVIVTAAVETPDQMQAPASLVADATTPLGLLADAGE